MNRALKFLVAVGAAAALAGCSDDDDNSSVPGPGEGSGQVRVIHASPDAPPVNVLVTEAGVTQREDEASPLDNLDFGDSTG
jgi:hypothetical protein